jgi:MFS family permease
MSPQRRVAILGAVGFVLAAAGCAYAGWGRPAPWAPVALAVAVALSEVAVVHLAFGRQRWSFSCTDGAIGAALVLAGGGWTVAAVVIGVVVAQLARRQPRLKVWFNVAQFAASTAVAAAFAHWLGGGLLGACAGMGWFWLLNHTLVAGAVAITSGRRLRGFLWASAPMSALHTAGNTSVGLLAAWLVINAPLGLLGLLVPMALLWFSYDQQTRRAAEARLFAELARGQERATGQSIDASARVVLTAAARLFGGADVELILMGADGPVRYVGDEYGVSLRERASSTVLGDGWVLRALGAGGVTTGVVDGRPFCSSVLGHRESPLALLHARRPRGSAGFGRREVTLAEVLVGQAESWLSVADLAASRDAALDRVEQADEAAKALGDLGANTAPSLSVLRESASRLARLATLPTGLGDVGEIVDELHSVERAVASLLGAIALAADSDLRAPAEGFADEPVRAEPEWTTTGLLSDSL